MGFKKQRNISNNRTRQSYQWKNPWIKKKYVIKSSEISKRINDDIARGYNMNLSLYYDKKTVPVRMINLKEGGKDYMATKKRKNKLLKILCCFGFLW